MPEEEAKRDPNAPEIVNPFAAGIAKIQQQMLEKNDEPPEQPLETPPSLRPKEEPPPGSGVLREPVQEPKGGEAETLTEEAEIEALLALKPEDLRTKTGAPVSETSRVAFVKMKDKLKKAFDWGENAKKKIKELESKGPPKAEDLEEYKKAVEERDRYKKEVDLFNFENSAEWISTFDAPIDKGWERVQKIVVGVEMDDDDRQSSAQLLRQAGSLMGDPAKEGRFLQIIDKISDDYIKGSSGTKFSKAMSELFDLSVKRAEAKADRAKAVEQVRQKARDQVGSSHKALQDRLDMELMAFEKTQLGEIFKKADFDFEAGTKANREKALQAMRDFQITGQVTQELAEMVRNYALQPTYQKEREFFLGVNTKLSRAFETVAKENEELKRRILDFRSEGSSDPPDIKGKGGKNGGVDDYRKPFGNIEERLKELQRR